VQVKTFFIICSIFFLPLNHAYGVEDSWNLERDRAGIQVYSKPVAGSNLNAIRGVTSIQVTMNHLVTILRDPTLRPRWDKLCGESYLYKTVSANEELVYVHSEMPWPVSDRDMLLRTVWAQDPNTLVVTMTGSGTQNILPEKSGRVRVVQAQQDFVLTPMGNGIVEVTSYIHLDPAGPLPSWLINSLSVESPYDALSRLKVLITEQSIVEQQYEFIREPQIVDG
jgi:hypothetical protein